MKRRGCGGQGVNITTTYNSQKKTLVPKKGNERKADYISIKQKKKGEKGRELSSDSQKSGNSWGTDERDGLKGSPHKKKGGTVREVFFIRCIGEGRLGERARKVRIGQWKEG